MLASRVWYSRHTVRDEAEKELFLRLAQVPKFREWIEAQLAKEYEIFIASLDKDYVAKSSGRAGLLQLLIKKLDEARKGS